MTLYYFYKQTKDCKSTNAVMDEFVAQYPDVEVTKVNVSKDKASASRFEVDTVPYCIYVLNDESQRTIQGPLDNINVLVDILSRDGFFVKEEEK